MPSPIENALEFCNDLIELPNRRWWIEPGPQPWTLFRDLWFAALAIESSSQWVTGDRDYGLVAGLDWEFVHR